MATVLHGTETTSPHHREIDVPASTAWPLVLAFGFTLIFAGLLTSVSVSVLGAVLAVAGCAGWFREVLPTSMKSGTRCSGSFAPHRTPRGRPPSCGARSSPRLAAFAYAPDIRRSEGRIGRRRSYGGAGMRVRCPQGRSIWYPINLLAASVYAQSLKLGRAVERVSRG